MLVLGTVPAMASDIDWLAWTSAAGLSYRSEAPELIGVWFPPNPLGKDEFYEDIVEGTLFGLSFVAFHYRAVGVRRRWERRNPLMVKLPRTLRSDLAAINPERLFRRFGGRLDTVAGSAEWWSPEWLAIYRGHLKHSPEHIEGPLRSLSAQLAAAPADVWV